MPGKYLTIPEAALLLKLSQQATYQAIKRGSLQTKTINKKQRTTLEWVSDYKKFRFDKNRINFVDGKPLFDKELGEFSARNASELLHWTRQKMFSQIRNGNVKASRKGTYYIIQDDELKRLMDIEFIKRKDRTYVEKQNRALERQQEKEKMKKGLTGNF